MVEDIDIKTAELKKRQSLNDDDIKINQKTNQELSEKLEEVGLFEKESNKMYEEMAARWMEDLETVRLIHAAQDERNEGLKELKTSIMSMLDANDEEYCELKKTRADIEESLMAAKEERYE